MKIYTTKAWIAAEIEDAARIVISRAKAEESNV